MQSSTLPSHRTDPDPFPLAACRPFPTAVFYQDDPLPAKTICATCPHQDPCLRHALTYPEPFGVWGGLSESERRAMLDHGIGRRRTR